jgi:CheY-specific phosphatase CheX
MLPNSAAKDLGFSPSNGMPNMISPFYSSQPFVPSIINSVISFSLDIQKPYLIRQPFVQESISVLIGMTGDIRGRCSSALSI